MTPIRRSLRCLTAVLTLSASMGCGSSTSVATAPSQVGRCSVNLGTTDSTVPGGGGVGRITVTTARECAWTASSDASWLTLTTPPSGQGDGIVEFRAAPNPAPVVRRGAVVLNDQRAEVTQAAGACVIQLSSPSASFSRSGGSGTVGVVASSPLCTWTASPDAAWITISSGASGQGNGAVAFQVAATTGPPRTGTIVVAGQRFDVTQSDGCTNSIAPVSHSAPATGSSGTIAVTTAPGCPWTAGSNAGWITVTEGGSGTGPGVVAFTVAPATGPARTGTMTVAGQTFTISQESICGVQVWPLTHAVGDGGGALSVMVSAAAGCGWTASSHVPWITIASGVSGNGPGVVTLNVAATTGTARTGTLTIAGQTVTVNQSQGCSYAIAPESQALPSSGGIGMVNVTAGASCPWTAVSGADWIVVTEGASGSGNGVVGFSAAATSGPERTGTLTIAGLTFTVNQGQACTFSLSPEGTTVPAAGGSRTFALEAPAGCTWSAASSVPWISIDSGGSGSGPGTVRVNVAANPGGERTGTVTAGGRAFTVEQEGACAYSLSASGLDMPATGGTGSVSVTTAAGCAWTATTGVNWIAITSEAGGSGNGTVAFTVATNTGPSRSGSIAIAGQTFTVNQAGDAGCASGVAPSSRTFNASGGMAAFNVIAPGTCSWTAVSNVPWINITGDAGGTGNGRVSYMVQPNTGPPRSGLITVQGQTHIVEQGS